MTPWIKKKEIDIDVLEESALAMAQSTLQNAINEAGISRAELARQMGRPRSFVTLMLRGNHNLTVRTMSRALAACGFEVRFQRSPIVWNWLPQITVQPEQNMPAHAGSTLPAANQAAGVVVPTCALQIGA